jgi:hypothetical protein
MAALKLESLVLRGVTILRDVLAVNPRLGTSQAKETSEIFISMRHPLASKQVKSQLAGWPEASDPYPTATAVLGAGRSRSCAGVLVCSARSPEQVIPFGWLSSEGGSLRAAVADRGGLTTSAAASVSENASRHLQAGHRWPCRGGIDPVVQATMQRLEADRAFKPATRTPPASTRGK